jgi:predicted aspartyl protease
MGVFALPLLMLLAQAGARESTPPVPLGSVEVVNDEPRYVAPTRHDQIGRIWAPVQINGQGPFRLVLATGASSSALTPRLAQALGLAIDGTTTVLMRGATGSATVPVVPVETLEIGDLLIQPRQLPVIPDALGGADGVLGMDQLANMRIRVDFRRDRITIVRSRNQRAAFGFETIPLDIQEGRLFAVQASMDGVPVRAIIDTGGQTTLGNQALRLALAERRKRGVQDGKLEQIVGSTLDIQVGTRLETPTLRLGSLLVRNPPMTFADFEIFKHWNMTAEPAMLVGMDVLGLLDTMIIDYRLKEMQVRLPRK